MLILTRWLVHELRPYSILGGDLVSGLTDLYLSLLLPWVTLGGWAGGPVVGR